MVMVGVLLRRTIKPGKKPKPGPAPIFLGAVDIHADKHVQPDLKAWTEKAFKDTYKDDAVRFQPGTDKDSGRFEIDKNNLEAISLTDDIMYMSLQENFDELRRRKEEKKKIKQEEAERKKQEEEEATKKKEEEEAEKAKNEKSAVPAPVIGTAPAVSDTQGGGQATSPTTAVPTWIYYVVLGMLGTYLWQQLNKLFSGGS
jgi:biotin carboxyl carrier protein